MAVFSHLSEACILRLVYHCSLSTAMCYCSNSGTTNLLRHLKVHHSIISVFPGEQKVVSVRDFLMSTIKPGVNRHHEKQLNQLLAQFVITSCSSFSVVENVDFLQWVSMLTDNRKTAVWVGEECMLQISPLWQRWLVSIYPSLPLAHHLREYSA